MKKIHKNAAERTAAYRERLKAKKEAATEAASEEAQYRALNLCAFAETAYETPAKTCLEEIQVHRSWLRALEEPDVFPGESLRQLARRTWDALLNSKGLGVVTDERGVWYPLFSPSQQNFQIPFNSTRFPGGPIGEGIRDGAKPEWFDEHWIAPPDCTGDEPINQKSLKPLPPVPIKAKQPEPKQLKRPEPQAKVESAPSFDEILAQARSVLPPEQDFTFGAFGVTPGLPTE